jgi:carboxymethylenebutenolidase
MIEEEEVEIQTPDGTADGFLYHAADGLRLPGVLHLTDIGGIRPTKRDMARRLAREGYTILLPNVFYRTGRPPLWEFPRNMEEERAKKRFAELTAPLTPVAVERDASAYVDFLAGHDAAHAGALAVVGYCFTGAVALRTAAARPERIAAAASFHGGGLATDAPTSPHLLLPKVQARLYFGHAVEDRSMPPQAIEKLDRALAAWGGTYESEVYQGARHGWTVPDSPVYHREQAERAYGKLRELFAAALA